MNQSSLSVSPPPPFHVIDCSPMAHLYLYTTYGVYTNAGASWYGGFRIFGILALSLSLIASIVAMAWGTVERNWSALSFDGSWSVDYDKVLFYYHL